VGKIVLTSTVLCTADYNWLLNGTESVASDLAA